MKLRWIDSNGLHNHDLTELADLRKRADGFLWFDVPEWNDDAEAVLTNEFHFHSMAITETATMFPESMCIQTTCSSLCTHLSSGQAATCTISS